MKRVVVSGGSGFLGSHIADQLTAQGFDVTIFDKRRSPYLQAEQTFWSGDVLDAKAIEEVVNGNDLIFHLAGLADLNLAHSRPLEATHLNLIGTLNFLEAARKAKVKRFVFASTAYVYSREGGFYRCSKQACETFIEEYQRQFGVNFTVLRYGSLYGPRANESNGVYRLLKQAALDGRIQHTGSPDDTREYVHVEDAARLSVQALADEYVNQHLVISGNHPLRLAELFTMFSEILGIELDVEYRSNPNGASRSHYRVTPYAFNPRVGRKLTSTCYVDMGQGILQLLEQLQEEGHLVMPVLSNRESFAA